MSLVSVLCEIIAQSGKVPSGIWGDHRAFSALIEHGFLREAGVLSSVVCDECDQAHSAQVVYESGGYGYYCLELGFLPLEPERLVAFGHDLPLLISRLADVFGCRQRKSSPIHGQTWRIGASAEVPYSVMLYFHPSLQFEDDVHDLTSALRREARSDWRLVITSRGSFPMAECSAVRLDELVEIDAETGLLNPMADTGILVGFPRKNAGGRPSEHGPLRKPLIKKRIQEGEAHDVINAEVRAIRSVFLAAYPDKALPSDSAIKRYIRGARGVHKGFKTLRLF